MLQKTKAASFLPHFWEMTGVLRRSEADVAEVTETAKPAAQNDVVALQSAGE
ncbi:hypothetical protein [Photorhabdus temperata]|uniref:hypothetical protein n=1 Tax=Photorhabdus temperata TaxID=574560 RepID=UPI000406E308|nr:hypothetical protein [Photorhabdus temperata]